MKKEDLIIDKLYINSNGRKAYYKGEDDNYGSIFELVDNIGCKNLTSSFPHLKSIASNTYWRHSSLHEKFNEIEDLNLIKIQISNKELLEKAKRDYPIGTEYYPAHLTPNEDYKCIMDEDSFNQLHISDNIILTDKSNKKGRSEVVYYNGTWATIISKPKIKEDVIPEYVECIKQSAGFTKGKIYQMINPFQITDDDNEVRNVKGYWKQEFSFSIKEAYELQNNPKFIVGKWYKSNIGATNWYYIKIGKDVDKNYISGETLNTTETYEKDSYWDSIESISQALKLGPLTDLSEIQQYLPEGHPDKMVNKSIEKWSVGSYVVPLQDKLLTRSEPLIKGKPYQIIRYSCIPYIICEKGLEINFNEDSDGEEREGIKWFATLEEAQEFAKTLKKEEMNKFRKDDYIVFIESEQNDKAFPLNYVFKQKYNKSYLSVYLDANGDENGWEWYRNFNKSFNAGNYKIIKSNWRYATEQEIAKYDKIGKPYDVNTLNMKEEEWIPQVGDWVISLINTPYGRKSGDLLKITSDSSYIISKSDNCQNFDGRIYESKVYSTLRKALPHEIPTNKVEGKSEKNISPIPEKWCVERTPNNANILNDWANSQEGVIGTNCVYGWLHSINYGVYGHDGMGYYYTDKNKHPKHTKITLEQFKKYVLKEDVSEIKYDENKYTPKFIMRIDPFEIAEETNGLNLSLKKDEEENEIKIYNTNIKTLDLSLKNN